MNEGRARRAVERILEDESLTADLTDPAAGLLLEWGLARAEEILQGEEGWEGQGVRLAVLRQVIREVARQAGQYPPAEQPERVRALLASMSDWPEGGRDGG